MQAAQAFGFEQVATEIIRGIMETVGDKPGLSPERKSAAQQTLVCTIMAFNPRDPLETTIAGQCMVYDHVMRDGAHDLLRGQHEEIKVKNRAGILASGKLFLQTMAVLDRIQARTAKSLAFAKAQEPKRAEAPAQPSPQPSLGEDDAAPIAAHALAPATEAAAPVQPAPSPELPPNAPPPEKPAPATPTPAVPLNLARTPVAPSNVPRSRQASQYQPAASAPPAAVRPSPVPRQQGLAASGPMMSLEALEEALLAGLTPEEKQSVRDGIARDKQEDARRAARDG